MRDQSKLILRILVSLACFAAVFYLVDFSKIMTLLKDFKFQQMLLALALMLLGHIGSALRFHFIVNRLGREFSKTAAIKASFVALWFNQLLPTGMGGDVVRAVLLAKQCGRLRIILAALLDRVLGLLMMILVMVIFLPLALWSKLDTATVGVVTLSGLLALLLGVAPVLMRKNMCRRIHYWPIYKICHLVFILGTALRRVLQPGLLHRLLLLLSLSFFPYAMYVAVLGNSFGLQIHPLEYIALVPLVFIAMQFPISMGGWGVRELASVYVFSYLGMSEELALIISLLYGFGLLITSIPGNLFWVYKKVQ